MGSIDFTGATLVGSYTALTALGKSVIEGQKIQVTGNISIENLDALTSSTYNVNLSDITFNLEDAGATLASSSNSSKVDAATAIAVAALGATFVAALAAASAAAALS